MDEHSVLPTNASGSESDQDPAERLPSEAENGKIRWKALALIFAIVGLLMIYGVLTMPDRSIAVVNRLVKTDGLYKLDAEERTNLTHFLTALAAENQVTTTISINTPYRRGALNVYIVDSRQSADSKLSHGNAAYVGRSDILFIDASYFRIGNLKVFTEGKDELTNHVAAPARVLAFFVLGHEFGHRQLHRSQSGFNFSEADYSQQRELEADAFSIKALEGLYASQQRRDAASIPAPISDLIDVTGEPTPLDRLTDHVTYAVMLTSNEVFDAPFPILSHSTSHPAFFYRLTSLLAGLKAQADLAKDENAQEQLELAEKLTAASTYLSSQTPVEIETSNPFQYAIVDHGTLYIIGNDGVPIVRRSIASLRAGEQVNQGMPAPQRSATVRYAWPGTSGHVFVLGRDDLVRSVDVGSGKAEGVWTLGDRFGDNSCAKEFLISPAASHPVYVSFCRQGANFVTLVGSGGQSREVELSKAVAALLSAGTSNPASIKILQFDLNAGGEPFVIFRQGEDVSAANFDENFKGGRVTALHGAGDIPEQIDNGRLHYRPKAFVEDRAGHVFRLAGDYLQRAMDLVDAEKPSASPSIDLDSDISYEMHLLDEKPPLALRQTFPLQGNRSVVNLEDAGAYLIDFNSHVVAPISRESWAHNEQFVSNDRGDWLYFRKYGTRILLFKGQQK